MGYIPLFMDVDARPCIVIGSGETALRRVRALLDAGAEVTAVGRDAGIEALGEAGKVHHLNRDYAPGDLRGFVLAYVATDNSAVARAAATEARELGIPINVADTPALCSFLTSAVIRRGALQIAISTGGLSPALAKALREKFESMLGEYELLLEVLGAARQRLKLDEQDAQVRSETLASLAASGLRECFERRDLDGADRILVQHLKCGLAELGFDSLRMNSDFARHAPE
jgi:precorrin-2 dehydrogenase/sirohydrochlorin ferrochelatase